MVIVEVRALVYDLNLIDNLLLFCAEDQLESFEWPCSNLKLISEAQGFSGEFGQIATASFVNDGEAKPRVALVVGLGDSNKLELEKIRKALGKALKEADKLKVRSLTIAPWSLTSLPIDAVVRALTETALLSSYRFDRYLSEKKEPTLKSVQIGYKEKDEIDVIQGLKVGQSLGTSTNLARDLVNEPANTLTPAQMALSAQKFGEQYGFEVEVLEEEAIAELDMKAFLSVARATVNRPRLIVMKHFGNPKEPDEIVGLVGKGLTFDSGGLSIKPAQGMGDMKSDMGGAASVIGAMCAIAEQNLPLNVVAVVAACENLIAANAYRPGDILGSMSGKTILIESTDAEGRLTLADAVHYIITKEKANTVLDIATLTGAAIVALGNTTTGVVTNNEKLYTKLQMASEESGERVWQLPNFPEYAEQNKTPVADLKNTGGRAAGTITAGLFIEAFVQDTPWIHLDIAGTSFASKASDYLTEGATGVGVRLLYHFIENFKK